MVLLTDNIATRVTMLMTLVLKLRVLSLRAAKMLVRFHGRREHLEYSPRLPRTNVPSFMEFRLVTAWISINVSRTLSSYLIFQVFFNTVQRYHHHCLITLYQFIIFLVITKFRNWQIFIPALITWRLLCSFFMTFYYLKYETLLKSIIGRCECFGVTSLYD